MLQVREFTQKDKLLIHFTFPLVFDLFCWQILNLGCIDFISFCLELLLCERSCPFSIWLTITFPSKIVIQYVIVKFYILWALKLFGVDACIIINIILESFKWVFGLRLENLFLLWLVWGHQWKIMEENVIVNQIEKGQDLSQSKSSRQKEMKSIQPRLSICQQNRSKTRGNVKWIRSLSFWVNSRTCSIRENFSIAKLGHSNL
jgi:hypothetical protein